jgi:hypothetical protein
MNEMFSYYATPGPITDPGRYGVLLDSLPDDVPSLARAIQGLLVHVFWANRYGLNLDDDRQEEVQLRFVAKQMARLMELDQRPLDEPRELPQRLVGNCRDFSTLFAAALRHKGVPARARCGFGRYFLPDQYEDHWVGEYWNAVDERWVMVDAQLDELQQRALAIDFDPFDVPREQFITGGRAWAMCRAGEADPDAFGIHDMHGLWFVRGNLVRDVASLNKMELLPWDVWGLAYVEGEDTLSVADLTELDEMAALSGHDLADTHDFARLRQRYESDKRWRVPPVIRSYIRNGPKLVDLFADPA